VRKINNSPTNMMSLICAIGCATICASAILCVLAGCAERPPDGPQPRAIQQHVAETTASPDEVESDVTSAIRPSVPREVVDSAPSSAPSSAPATQPSQAATLDDGPIQQARVSQPVDFEPDRTTYANVIRPFLQAHCVRCHGPTKQEADFRVDEQLPNDFLDRTATERWSEVLNMLNSDDMPPEGEPRPDHARVNEVVEWVERERVRGEQARKVRTIVLRRLNREEYNNTIRDLIGIDFDFVDEFPEDPPAGGFDNNGAALTISPFHLELYLKTAQKILDRAIVTTQQQPASIKWRFELEQDQVRNDHNRIRIDDDRNARVMMTRYSNQDRNGIVVIPFWGVGCQISYFHVPHPGEYIIRLRAAGVTPPESAIAEAGPRIAQLQQQERESRLASDEERRKSREGYDMWSRPWIERHFATDRSYRYGPPRLKVASRLGAEKRVDAVMDVDAPENAPRLYEIRSWFTPENSGMTLSNEYRIPYNHLNGTIRNHADFPRPALLIDWVELEGPIYDNWPPSSHRRILVDSPHKGRDEAAYARDVLKNFMRRAWRRLVRDEEVEPMVALFQQVRTEKPSFEEAIKAALMVVLSSPDFLFLVEEGVGRDAATVASTSLALNDHELACRLSYFLWSSMPDDALTGLAESGALNRPATLRQQVDRMLADEKSRALVKNFTGQWLRLREVGFNPPAGGIYPRYDDHLEVSMRGETEAFFEHVLRNDLSTLDFLRSDYLAINERLARFYDIPGVKGDHFRAVAVPPDVPRGGLVTQASILSVTSNGTRTSPVWRGVWILENLLGDPPPPPPPNAGDIPPGVPGIDKVTVRQRLQLHREKPQCARCHNKIDSLGFALENFAASGEWRNKEHRIYMNPPTQTDGVEIDATARFPDGTEINGVGDLQRELLNREDQFLRCLSSKLYTYAMGRELGFADDEMIDDAVQTMKSNGYTLRSLVHHIVSSDVFRAK